MPQRASLPLDGGCLCGKARYRLSAPPLFICNCHCANCQKLSGAAFAVNATIREEDFSILQGAPKRAEWTSDAGNRRYGLFCGDCGSRLVHGQAPSNGFLSLRCGSFDEKSWIEPVGDIWLKSAQPWVAVAPGRLAYETQPSDFRIFVERYRAQGRFAI